MRSGIFSVDVAAAITKAEDIAKPNGDEKTWKAAACQLLFTDQEIREIVSKHAPSHLAAVIKHAAKSADPAVRDHVFSMLLYCRGTAEHLV
jgi:hypothetical protein